MGEVDVGRAFGSTPGPATTELPLPPTALELVLGANSFQSPSETTSTVPSVTLIAV